MYLSKQSAVGLAFFCLLVGNILSCQSVFADQQSGGRDARQDSESQVIHEFTSGEEAESEILKIGDQRKRQIMFAMGVPLLLFIVITVSLGIAMGVFGKDVYVAHMIFAGLSLTLALGHAIVGLVWFWPF